MIKFDVYPTTGLREFILDLAAKHNVVYVPTDTDAQAEKLSELSDKAVQMDEIDYLLIALARADVISRKDMIKLLGNYLDETKPSLSTVDCDSGYRVGPHVDDWTPPESHRIRQREWERLGLIQSGEKQ